MTARSLGITSRVAITGTSLGSRQDLAVRRIATPLPTNATLARTEFVLGPAQFTDFGAGAGSYLFLHTDAPVTLRLTDADGKTLNLVVSSVFLITAPIAGLRITNLDPTAVATVTAVLA